MKPAATYRLADGPSDYRRIHAMCDRLNLYRVPMGWPTVIAEKDGQVIGVVATRPSDKAVMVSRAAADGPQPIYTLIRLMDAYENVLRAAGVKLYLIPVEVENLKLQKSVEKLFDLKPWITDEDNVWYRRQLAPALRKAG